MTPAQKEAIADQLEARIRRVFRPDEGGDIVKWLEENIRQIPFSPMPYGFRVSETPWLAEPLLKELNRLHDEEVCLCNKAKR